LGALALFKHKNGTFRYVPNMVCGCFVALSDAFITSIQLRWTLFRDEGRKVLCNLNCHPAVQREGDERMGTYK
jgi:hypothetical protein